jgi:HlyD family secretion protein
MRRLAAAAALLIVAGLLVWALLPRPVGVETDLVAPRDISVAVEEQGKARIREVYVVSATIAGRLARGTLHAGDPVVAGQTIVAALGPVAPALLDARARAIAEATVAAAGSAVDLARAQLAEAEAARDFARAEAARARALFERSAIAQRALDAAVLGQMTAEAAAQSARSGLDVRERELDSARAVIAADAAGAGDACCVTIVAPVSGRVLRVLTEDEQVVAPGTPIIEIGDLADLEVVVEVLSRDAVRIRKGARATVTGWGGAPIAAEVDRIEPSAVTRISALGIEEQRVEVILGLRGDAALWQTLGHGFRVIARIEVWRGEGVLSIPVGALLRDGSDWAAYAVEDGRARLRRVEIGARDDAAAEVLGGLPEGTAVILHPGDRIADGVSVEALP